MSLGCWLTGTKGTQAAVGQINYFPVKAVQSFAEESDDYSNIIYLGSWPVVKVRTTPRPESRQRAGPRLLTKLHRGSDYFLVGCDPSFSLPPSLAARHHHQVLGTYACPKRRRLEFVVKSIGLGPLTIGSKGDGFFTFFFLDEKIAVARGQSGGLALWAKET